MAEITDEMITRALAVIMTPPGLQYFDDLASMAHNREIVRSAIAAALEDPDDARRDPFRMPEVEDRIRRAVEDGIRRTMAGAAQRYPRTGGW